MKIVVAIITLGLALAGLVSAQTSPARVILLWEAETSVPPFYAGHSRPSADATVKIIAWPEFKNQKGENLAAGALNFSWEKDDRNVAGVSGPGKNELVIIAAQTGNRIKVTARAQDGRTAEQTLNLPPAAAKLLLYEKDPAGSVDYRRALGEEIILVKPELTVLAEPYFFSAGDAEEERLQYDWRLGGKRVVSNPDNPREATFALPAEGSGENLLTVRAQNTAGPLQTATRQLLIKFGISQFDF